MLKFNKFSTLKCPHPNFSCLLFPPYLVSSKILITAQLVLQSAKAVAMPQQYCPVFQASSISSHFTQAKGSNRSYLNNSASLYSTHFPCAADLPLNLISSDTDECWAHRSDEGTISQAVKDNPLLSKHKVPLTPKSELLNLKVHKQTNWWTF